jgi:hypothetical protein
MAEDKVEDKEKVDLSDIEVRDPKPVGDFRLENEPQESDANPKQDVTQLTDWRLQNTPPTSDITGQPTGGVEWRAPVAEIEQQRQQEAKQQLLETVPNKTDNKSVWERYAREIEIDTKGMNKDQIIEAVEAKLEEVEEKSYQRETSSAELGLS